MLKTVIEFKLDMFHWHNTGFQIIWNSPQQVFEVNCNKIMIGHQFLDEYYEKNVEKSYDSVLWWRDTTPTHYYIHRNGLVPEIFIDGFDNNTHSYPQFIGVSFGLFNPELTYIIDLYGNKYLGIAGGKYSLGYIAGISYIEGYLCDWSYSSFNCSSGVPSESEIEAAISGICVGGNLNALLYGVNLGALCHGFSLENIFDWSSSVMMFYAGAEMGAGVSPGIVFPLSYVGVPSNPNQGWKWLIEQRQQYGMTWNKVLNLKDQH